MGQQVHVFLEINTAPVNNHPSFEPFKEENCVNLGDNEEKRISYAQRALFFMENSSLKPKISLDSKTLFT